MIIESGKKKIMKRKLKSFSMAELLIALLAVSVIVSATIPTFTRKASTNEQVFKFVTTGSGGGNSGYTCPNDSCSIVIGDNRITENNSNPTYTGDVYNEFITEGNSLKLVKNYSGGSNNNKASGYSDNSHLTFFNKNIDKSSNNTYQVGRMYFDETNLGIGINALAYLNPGPGPNSDDDYGRRNTAFGQLALYSFKNPKGVENKSNSNYKERNKFNGTDNTGVGYKSLSADDNSDQLYVDLTPTNDYVLRTGNKTFGIQANSANTAVGSFALTCIV